MSSENAQNKKFSDISNSAESNGHLYNTCDTGFLMALEYVFMYCFYNRTVTAKNNGKAC